MRMADKHVNLGSPGIGEVQPESARGRPEGSPQSLTASVHAVGWPVGLRHQSGNHLSLAVTGIRLPLRGGSEHPAVSGQDGTRHHLRSR